MRFKDYLKEEARSPTSTGVLQEDLYAWIKKHSKHFLDALLGGHDVQIFRGQQGVDFYYALGDTSKFRRKAANTSNEVQSLIATSSKWEEFPSRESAYICTTSLFQSSGYGKPYMVIPADDARIGICPAHDFWPSFRKGLKGTSLHDMAEINQVIEFVRERGNTGLALPEDNPKALRRDLRQLTGEMIKAAAKGANSPRGDDVLTFGTAMINGGYKNAEDYLEQVLDPEVNGFQYMRADDFGGVTDKEVWIEGKCAFIQINNKNTPDQIIERLKKDLYQ